jgi:PRTRC genetic system protein C
MQYPELATAAINGPEAVGDKLRYEFLRSVGSKG